MTEYDTIEPANLPPATAALLEILAQDRFFKRYTLVGGTALSLRLGHRQSEDLDFIFDGEKLPDMAIKRKIDKMFPRYNLIRYERGYQLDYIVNGVKLTFFSTGAIALPFDVMPYSTAYKYINVASVEIMPVLKMAAIAQRSAFRDYYDLYYLAKHIIPFTEILQKCKLLLPNVSAITYTETLVYTDDIEEDSIGKHLWAKESVTKRDIADYFATQIQKLK